MHPKITDLGMNRLSPHAAEPPPAEPTPPAPAADLTPDDAKFLQQLAGAVSKSWR